jgi:mannose-6-phosphate isomerase
LNNDTLLSLLNSEEVEKGDCFFTPAKRVHAIGKGVMLAEIQQTSDTTFRLYDYNRLENGKKRKLHIAQSLECLDYSGINGSAKTHYHFHLNHTEPLVECPYFSTNVLHLSLPVRKDYVPLDSFAVYIVCEGSAIIECLNTELNVRAGDCVLLPAVCDSCTITPNGYVSLLETYIE